MVAGHASQNFSKFFYHSNACHIVSILPASFSELPIPHVENQMDASILLCVTVHNLHYSYCDPLYCFVKYCIIIKLHELFYTANIEDLQVCGQAWAILLL